MKKNIVIIVEGGLIQSIYSDVESVPAVEVYDFDDQDKDLDALEREMRQKITSMKQIY